MLECLEDRTLLSSIAWSNRGINGGADNDGFAAVYGAATAPLARAIVDRAIDDWERVIENFNYAGGGNIYSLTVNAGASGTVTGRGVTGSFAVDAAGKPTGATITLDDDGGGGGWFFDATPNDDTEFTSLLSEFAASFNGVGAAANDDDFFRTIVHEMGHAMGLVRGGPVANQFAIRALETPCGTDQVDGSSNLFRFDGARVTATLTDAGGRHTYEGPLAGGAAGCPTSHPNDLLNDGRGVNAPPTTRQLISDLDAQILADAYGYSIRLPSQINTFFAIFNPANGVLTVSGSPGTSDDQIVIDMAGGLRVQVNGSEEIFDGNVVNSINVLAGAGKDFVNVTGEVGIPITIDGGDGNDTIIGGDVTIFGGAGDDSIVGGAGADSLDGGSGRDTILGLEGNDSLVGGSDDDQIFTGPGVNVVTAGLGNDLFDFSENTAAVTFDAGDGNDTVIGSNFDDNLSGGIGNDRLEGRGGADSLSGGDGNDQLLGGTSPDRLDGGAGSNLIDGGDDPDTLLIVGTSSADTLRLSTDNVPDFGHLIARLNGVDSPVADIELIDATLLTGADLMTVDDLGTTKVRDVMLDETGAVDSVVDTVIVNGTSQDENFSLAPQFDQFGSSQGTNVFTPWGRVSLLRGFSSSPLTKPEVKINAGAGDDIVTAAAGVESLVLVELNGQGGDDFLSADATLNGGDGNDMLIGSGGNDRLDGGAGDDFFVGGGGVDTLIDFDGGNDTILVPGTPGADLISLTLNAAGDLVVTVNGMTTTYADACSPCIERVAVVGGDDDDSLEVDSTRGALEFEQGIDYDGGAGADSLTLLGAPAGAVVTDTYSVGPVPGSGTSVIYMLPSGATQAVHFYNLEPVFDQVPSETLLVVATPADNAINYSCHAPGDGSPTATYCFIGRVTIDNFESIEFTGKQNLVIDALAGSDEIHVNNSGTPAGLTGTITIVGGDPTASDTLIVSATVRQDAIDFTATEPDAGVVAIAGLPAVIFSTTESVVLNGLGGNDTLRVLTPASDNIIRYTPGDTIDSAAIRIDSLVPMSFVNLGAFGAVEIFDAGGSDRLVYRGTITNDTFRVNARCMTVGLTTPIGEHVHVNASGVEALTLDELDGDDLTVVGPALSFGDCLGFGTLPPAYSGGIQILAGDPSDSDRVELVDVFGDRTIELVPAAAGDTVTGIVGGPVTLVNVEQLTLDGSSGDDTVLITGLGAATDLDRVIIDGGGDAGDTLTVTGSMAGDTFLYTATGPTSGALIRTNQVGLSTEPTPPEIVFTGVAGTFTVAGGSNGFDELHVLGTNGNDVITSGPDSVSVNGNKAVTVGAGIERLELSTFAGDDDVTFSVTVAGIQKVIDVGVGNDSVDASLASDPTISGGDGDDSLLGSMLDDFIDGGRGNDTLRGRHGNDVLYGGEGDDELDGGRDTNWMFGGDGSDVFSVYIGDVAIDYVEGGAGENDALNYLAFNADDTTDVRIDQPDNRVKVVGSAGAFPGTRAVAASVEVLQLLTLAGNDDVVVHDLYGTDVRKVFVDLAQVLGDDEVDSVTVEGRTIGDNVMITSPMAGTVDVAGLAYDFRITSATMADSLTVFGGEGDDVILAAAGVENTIMITLDGGEGDDVLSADAVMNGRGGNDTFIVATGNNICDGDEGDDVLLLAGIIRPQEVVYSGGPGFDSIRWMWTDGDDVGSLSTWNETSFRIMTSLNGMMSTIYADRETERVEIWGRGGEDAFEVSLGGTLAPGLSLPIVFDGGPGTDGLTVSGSPTTQVDEVIYTLPAGMMPGRLDYEDAMDAQLMSIAFTNIEPVLEIVRANVLTVYGTPEANAINLAPVSLGGFLSGLALDGRVTVDNYERIDFANKTQLSIIAGPGSDEINLDGPIVRTSSQPSALKTITVVGGDPGASDRLIINGTPSRHDHFLFEPWAQNAGSVIQAFGDGPSVEVNFTGIEDLQVVGQLSEMDDFAMGLTSGDDQVEYSLGATPDTAIIHGTMDQNGAPFPLVPTTLSGMATQRLFNTQGDVGGTDSFVFNGSASGDAISVAPRDGVPGVTVTDTLHGLIFADVILSNFASAIIEGHDGDDTFDVEEGIDTPVEIHGGEPSASDVLRIHHSGVVSMDLDSGAEITADGLAAVRFSEVEAIAADQLRVVTPNTDDTIVCLATEVRILEASLQIDRELVCRTLSVFYARVIFRILTIDDQGGSDTLQFLGSTSADEMTANLSTGQVGLRTVAGEFPALLTKGVERLVFDGLDGDDTFKLIRDTSQPPGSPSAFSNGIVINAGGPTASDSVSVDGTFDADTIELRMGVAGDEVTGVVDGPVTLVGVEHLTINTHAGFDRVNVRRLGGSTDLHTVAVNMGGDAVDTLSVGGTPNADVFTYVPTGPSAGSLVRQGSSPTLDFTGTSFFRVGDQDLGGFDELHVLGTEGDDFIASEANAITVNENQAVFVSDGIDKLVLAALGGDDRITFALQLGSVQKVVDAGTGDDVVDASLALDPTIVGGDGDDQLTGSVWRDFIDGGRGRDEIFGLAEDDSIYGGEGDDVIDGGEGDDQLFGGDGSDSLIDQFGEGNDRVEGGAGESDVFRFKSPALISAGGTFLFARQSEYSNRVEIGSQFGVTADIASVEHLVLFVAAGGKSEVTVRDLFVTEVRKVTVEFGASTEEQSGLAFADTLVVHGREVTDNLMAVVDDAGVVTVEGLVYNVALRGADPLDTLTILGQHGDDILKAAAGVEDFVHVELHGGPGDDSLSADAFLFGDDGDDQFMGGAGPDIADGGLGDDVFWIGSGLDQFVGGPGTDSLLLMGNDRDNMFSVTTSSLTATGSMVVTAILDGATSVIEIGPDVEAADVRGLGGDDMLLVALGSRVGTSSLGLRTRFDGGLGTDGVTASGSPDAGVDEVIYSLPAGEMPGRLVYEDAMDTVLMSIEFMNIEPVNDFVPANNLTVYATPEANAINFEPLNLELLFGDEPDGVVTVDNYERIYFGHKARLIIEALAGSDEINLDGPLLRSSSSPSELERILVHGGDPGASDRLIINGAHFRTDDFEFEPTGQGAGSVKQRFSDGPPVRVDFNDTEHLYLVGQLHDGDGFGMTGTHGDDQIGYSLGETPDTAIIRGTMDRDDPTLFSNGPFPLVTTNISGIAGRRDFNRTDDAAGSDSFVFNGTESNDHISLTPGQDHTEIILRDIVHRLVFADLLLANFAIVFIEGRDGDDRIDVSGEFTTRVEFSSADLSVLADDTRGPQVTGVFFDPIHPALANVNAFTPKQFAVPTPLTQSIEIRFQDGPARAAGAQYPVLNAAIAGEPGHYRLVGDATGIMPIASVSLDLPVPGVGEVATGRVTLNFGTPLPDDRFTLFISDRLRDDAGNGVDGETNLDGPVANPDQYLPSGDGIGGGPFVARFTVDSRPEIGTFANGSWYIDLNGNGTFDDPNNHDTDFTNGDIVWKFGVVGDVPVVGNWLGSVPPRYDKIGVYGRRGAPGGQYTFELDLNANGAFDAVDVSFPFAFGGRPFSGDWNGDGLDDMGVFGPCAAASAAICWQTDRDGNRVLGPGETIAIAAGSPFRGGGGAGAIGMPIAGDWDGTGGPLGDRVGVYFSGTRSFFLDLTGDFQYGAGDRTIVFGFAAAPRELPVAADFDADGDTNIGLYVRDRIGMFPHEAAEWYVDLGRPGMNEPGDGLFQPPPTGWPGVPAVFQDIFYQFGDELAEGVVGNFDPPPPGTPVGNPVVQPVAIDHANTAGPAATPIFLWDTGDPGRERGAIEAVGDTDVFQFTAHQSGRIAVEVTTPESNLDSNLAVQSASGRRLARNDNMRRGTTDSRVELNVVAGQSYYLAVNGSRRSVGSYELAVDYVPGGAGGRSQGSEVRNQGSGVRNREPTPVLTLGSTGTHTSGMIRASGDPGAPGFRLTSTVAGRLELTAAAKKRGLDTVLEVTDTDGRLIASNDNLGASSTDSRLALDVLAGETYLIRVLGQGGGRGAFTLAVDWLLDNVL